MNVTRKLILVNLHDFVVVWRWLQNLFFLLLIKLFQFVALTVQSTNIKRDERKEKIKHSREKDATERKEKRRRNVDWADSWTITRAGQCMNSNLLDTFGRYWWSPHHLHIPTLPAEAAGRLGLVAAVDGFVPLLTQLPGKKKKKKKKKQYRRQRISLWSPIVCFKWLAQDVVSPYFNGGIRK